MIKTGLLSEGTLLKASHNREVTIKRWLAEGHTGHVYLASMADREDVIVKMAKFGQDAFLEDEARVLDTMREKYIGKGRSHQPSPQVFETGTYEKHYFIVMEYLKVKPLPDFLLEGKSFSETQVVQFAEQLYEFLECMHSSLKRSYPDFKFQDLCLEENSDNDYRLRVLDLGGLGYIENPGDRGGRYDVLTAASYLLTLIVGYKIFFLAGDITEEVEKSFIESPFTSDISWGAQQFFRRLLCRVPDFRIQTSAEAFEWATGLSRWWQMPESDLLSEAYRHLNYANAATGKTRNDHTSQSRMQMDIYMRRGGDSTLGAGANYEQIMRLYEASSYLEQGEADLKLKEYDAAIQKFNQGETFEGNPSLFRRWRYLALALKQTNNPSLLEPAKEISQLFEAGKYSDMLAKLNPFAGTDAFALLESESRIYALYKAGHEYLSSGEYQKAQQEFSQIQQWLGVIPESDRKSIRQTEGDSKSLADECARLFEEVQVQTQYKQDIADIKSELLKGIMPVEKIRKFVNRYRHSAGNSEMAEEIIKLSLEKFSIGDAYLLADILYWSIPEKSKQFRENYLLVHDLYDASIALNGYNRIFAIPQLINFLERTRSNPLLSGKVQNIVDQLVVDPQDRVDDPKFWEEMEKLVQHLPATSDPHDKKRQNLITRIRELRRQSEQQQQQELKNLVERIKFLLYAPQPGKLEREKLWESIKSFSIPDARMLFKNASGRLALLDEYIKDLENLVQQDIFSAWREDARKLRNELSDQRKYIPNVKENSENQPSLDIMRVSWLKLSKLDIQSSESDRSELFDLLEQCLILVWNEGTLDEQIFEIIRGVYQKIREINPLGAGFISLYQFREDSLHRGREKLQQTDGFYKSGNLDNAWRAFQDCQPAVCLLPEGVNLYLQMLHTQELVSWSSENAGDIRLKIRKQEILEKLKKYTQFNIPPVYYSKLGIYDYLIENKQFGLMEKLGLGNAGQSDKPSSNIWRTISYGFTMLVVFAAFVFFAAKGNWFTQLAALQEQPTSTLIPLTWTQSPTPTLKPTDTPPPLTPTNTPIPIQTAVPMDNPDPSNYKNPDITSITGFYPQLPIKSMNTWKLDNAFKKCQDKQDEPVKFCATMTAPLPAGQYAIYIYNDLQNLKRTAPRLIFEVESQDSINSSLSPIIASTGYGEFQYGTINEVSSFNPPLPDIWIWVGNYKWDQPGTITLKVGMVEGQTAELDDATFQKILETVLLVNIEDSQWLGLPPAPQGYHLLSILDESNLCEKDADSKCVPFPVEQVVPFDLAWNGGYLPVKMSYFIGSGVLSPGTYKIFYHLVDQTFIGTLTVMSLEKDLVNKEILGTGNPSWLDMGDFTLKISGQPLIMINGDATTSIPVDAILIYMQDK